MPRREFQASLDDLQADVATMGRSVLDQVDDSLTALAKNDRELAETVIEGDEAIDDRYLDLEADCIDLFALQQPVATDLRLVAGSFKILTDLERIGDLAVNVGRYTLRPAESRDLEVEIEPVGRRAHDLVADALDAYAAGDAGATVDIAARDDEIDARCQHASEQVVRELIEGRAAEDIWSVEQVLDDVSRVLLTIRDLERVADHGVNIAARTRYMVEADPSLLY